MAQAEKITFPIGRYVAGSLYTGRTVDADGNQLVFKTGQKAGQPRTDYSFGVAFAKVPGQHWASSEWGAKLWAMGHTVLANAGDRPDFSWKVEDGDSTMINKKNRRNCDRDGYPGHWIVFFTSIDKPATIVNADGSQEINSPGLIKPGYYIQVAGDIKPNGSNSNPGLYVTPHFVAFSGACREDQIISLGQDASSAGLGQSAAPAGMVAPPATPAQTAGIGAPPPPAAPAPAPVAPPPAAVAPPVAAPAPAPVATYAPPPAPVAIAPNPAMTAVPAPLAPAGHAAPPPTAPAPVPAPAAPSAPIAPTSLSSGPQMTATAIAAGYTYESLKGNKWTDDQMRAAGYLV